MTSIAPHFDWQEQEALEMPDMRVNLHILEKFGQSAEYNGPPP